MVDRRFGEAHRVDTVPVLLKRTSLDLQRRLPTQSMKEDKEVFPLRLTSCDVSPYDP